MCYARQSLCQLSVIIRACDLAHAKLRQMRIEKLRIKQRKATLPQTCGQKDQRDFAGVARARKHALAKKRAAQRNAIDAADQLALPCTQLPDLYAMRVAFGMQDAEGIDDVIVDPR